MARGTEVPDDSDSRYEGLDDDERAEARALELRQSQSVHDSSSYVVPLRRSGF